jgi:hypothetical protein
MRKLEADIDHADRSVGSIAMATGLIFMMR